MALNDVVQIKLFTEVLGVETLNVFHYKQTNSGSIDSPLAQTVNNAFWASIDTELLACLHPSSMVLRAELVFLAFPAIWNVKTINAAGTWVDSTEQGAAPRNVTIGVRYQREAVGQRHGYKRFSGASVDALEDGQWGAALAVEAIDLATVLFNGFTATAATFSPFIAHRPITIGANPTGYVPIGTTFYQNSSQNTRK